MLQLNISSPSLTTLRYLATKQAAINSLPVDQQADKAQDLWDSKSNPKAGKIAFDELKETLLGMCVSTELCNYCEHNEATDVEHIYPKSFFPGRTFQLSNFLLACKSCNTKFKLDKFYVFSPAQSSNAVALQRKQLPPSEDAAFIDPHVEDPMDFLFLEIKHNGFHLVPHPLLTDPRDIAKAERTLSVLQIGDRPALAFARETALNHFQNLLSQYQKLQACTTWDELEDFVRDPHLLNYSNDIDTERQSMLDNIKRSIIEYQHPTVWREMQRQHQRLNRAKKLFQAVPNALTWSR
ncbi:hypothetical protein GCM10027346_17600 [Hymenobacter seoulensis]